MPREPIPEDLRRFVLTSVPSVPFVEALLIYRGSRGMALDNDIVARRLYMGDKAALEVIEQLRAARMIEAVEGTPPSHRFAPLDPDLAGMVEMLAGFYRTHLVEVTDLIHSRTARKAQQFADAFKIRKDS